MTFKKKIFENGLRLITVPMTDNPSVTILVVVEAGSKYEDKKTNGISHFLEHLVFKGTPKRPKASDISRELDSLGANYNAFTTQEFTGYYAKVASKNFDTALDIVSDMYVNPTFDAAELEKEKGVIVEEIRMYQDLPQRHVHDVLSELMFGDQPAGWYVIGTEDNVRSFTREAVIQYRKEHYVSGSTTVIVSGSFDEKEVEKKIIHAFRDMPKGKKKGKLKVVESQSAPAIRTEFKETDQTHLAIGIRTFSAFDERLPVMNVMAALLGGGMSSRLFAKMRDEMGICYYIRASHDAYTDHGDLSISAGVDNKRVVEAVKEILAECKKLTLELVTPEELKKVKDYIAGTSLLELETSENRAEYAGIQEVIKHEIESPEEHIQKIQAVTAADIQKLAKDIFVNKGLNIALIGRATTADIQPHFML